MLRATDGPDSAGSGTELAAAHDFAAAMHRWRVSLAARHGLTLTDTVVLTTLLGAAGGSADPTAARVTAAELAQAVDVASGRLTGALDRLEAAGFARRVPNPTDRRSVLIAPTEAGHRANAALDTALQGVVADDAEPAFREWFTARLNRLSHAVDQVRGELDGTG